MMLFAQAIVVVIILSSITGAALLALLGSRFVLRNVWHTTDTNTLPPSISIVIPSLGGGSQLDDCLNALHRNMPRGANKVIVVLQQSSKSTADGVRAGWLGPVKMEVCEMEGKPSKSSAISLGLRSVETEWVLMLDSDVHVCSLIHMLLDSLADIDAVYGLILPTERQSDTLLERIGKADKVVSHGVWRVGRFATGLWPNLPGQCYAIRSSLLRGIYDDSMGHLDDMAITLNLVARRCRIRFVPAVVCFEKGRATWFGLLSQRVRWSIGLAQSFGKLQLSSDNFLGTLGCWAIHAWLYFGWPIFTAITSFVFVAVDRPLWALGMVCTFLVTWSLLAMVGNRVFIHVDPNYVPVKFVASAFPASCLIMLAQTLGLLAVPGFLLVELINPLFGYRLLYRR